MPFYFNENADPFEAGDVTAFETESAILCYLEPWIAKEPHLVFSGDGVCYRIVAGAGDAMSLHAIGRTLTPDEIRPFMARTQGG